MLTSLTNPGSISGVITDATGEEYREEAAEDAPRDDGDKKYPWL